MCFSPAAGIPWRWFACRFGGLNKKSGNAADSPFAPFCLIATGLDRALNETVRLSASQRQMTFY
jgi:hypothetical protein